MSKKSIKSRIFGIITAFVVIFVAIIVAAMFIYTPYTEEEIKENNKNVAVTYFPEESRVRLLSFDTNARMYDFENDGYPTKTYFSGRIYNCTEDVLENVCIIFKFSIDSKSHRVEYEIDELAPGENVFSNEYVGTIYRRFSSIKIGDINLSIYYEKELGDIEYCNEYMNPDIEHYHYSIFANAIVCILSAAEVFCIILFIVTIISHFKNKILVEEVSETFIVEETEKQPEPEKIEKKEEIVVHCQYCGGEFSKMHTKCPDCGARLKKKK